jgi:hypothetical protein
MNAPAALMKEIVIALAVATLVIVVAATLTIRLLRRKLVG